MGLHTLQSSIPTMRLESRPRSLGLGFVYFLKLGLALLSHLLSPKAFKYLPGINRSLTGSGPSIIPHSAIYIPSACFPRTSEIRASFNVNTSFNSNERWENARRSSLCRASHEKVLHAVLLAVWAKSHCSSKLKRV